MPPTVSIIIALIGAAGTVYGIVTAAMQMRRAARKDDTAGGVSIRKASPSTHQWA